MPFYQKMPQFTINQVDELFFYTATISTTYQIKFCLKFSLFIERCDFDLLSSLWEALNQGQHRGLATAGLVGGAPRRLDSAHIASVAAATAAPSTAGASQFRWSPHSHPHEPHFCKFSFLVCPHEISGNKSPVTREQCVNALFQEQWSAFPEICTECALNLERLGYCSVLKS